MHAEDKRTIRKCLESKNHKFTSCRQELETMENKVAPTLQQMYAQALHAGQQFKAKLSLTDCAENIDKYKHFGCAAFPETAACQQLQSALFPCIARTACSECLSETNACFDQVHSDSSRNLFYYIFHNWDLPTKMIHEQRCHMKQRDLQNCYDKYLTFLATANYKESLMQKVLQQANEEELSPEEEKRARIIFLKQKQEKMLAEYKKQDEDSKN